MAGVCRGPGGPGEAEEPSFHSRERGGHGRDIARAVKRTLGAEMLPSSGAAFRDVGTGAGPYKFGESRLVIRTSEGGRAWEAGAGQADDVGLK